MRKKRFKQKQPQEEERGKMGDKYYERKTTENEREAGREGQRSVWRRDIKKLKGNVKKEKNKE